MNKEFTTDIFKNDSHTILSHYLRRWCVSLFPYAAAIIIAMVVVGYFNIRITLAMVMIVSVSLPMIWILAVDQLISRATELAAPCRFTIAENTLTIETFRQTFPDENGNVELLPKATHTFTPGDFSIVTADSMHLSIKTPIGTFLIPNSHIIR